MSCHISYPSAPKTQLVTEGELKVIQYLYANNQVVAAIKFAKTQYDLGLYEAKHLCIEICKMKSYTS